MPLTLTTVVDGTEADATDVNQYKTAIETLAGAGWNDGGGDLDVEELSDEVIAARGGLASLDTRLDVSLDNAGTIKTGAVNKQTMLALDSAAAVAGDAVRYEEFRVEHTAAGNHSGVAWVRYLYSDAVGSATAGVDAAALPEYDDDVVGATMVALRVAFQKTAQFNTIGLRGQYYASSITKAPEFALKVGAGDNTLAATAATTWTDFDEDDLYLDVSGLTNGVTYELDVEIRNDGNGTALGKLRYLSVFAYYA